MNTKQPRPPRRASSVFDPALRLTESQFRLIFAATIGDRYE
jgi:hypothetical protein